MKKFENYGIPYDVMLDDYSVKNGYANFDEVLNLDDKTIIKKIIKQVLFFHGWEETLNYQTELFELKSEINRLRVYLQ
jgi:hypothetical protein